MVFSDSDFAGDIESQVSVMGFCILLLGVPISLQSKAREASLSHWVKWDIHCTFGGSKRSKVHHASDAVNHDFGETSNHSESRQCWSNLHVREPHDKSENKACGHQVPFCVCIQGRWTDL